MKKVLLAVSFLSMIFSPLIGTSFAAPPGGGGGGGGQSFAPPAASNSAGEAEGFGGSSQFGADGTKLVNVPGASSDLTTTGDSLITIIRNIVNYILGMLAFICLLLLLYAGWLYLTGKTDDAIKRIRQVLIALLIIAASYFILSFIFYIIESFFGA